MNRLDEVVGSKNWWSEYYPSQGGRLGSNVAYPLGLVIVLSQKEMQPHQPRSNRSKADTLIQ